MTGVPERYALADLDAFGRAAFRAAGADDDTAAAAAEKGMIGLIMCNTDSFVRLHDGASRFHGTNPISCAIPSPGERPWLLDIATSSVPRNRVVLDQTLGKPLPEGVASDARGEDTTDPGAVDMLAAGMRRYVDALRASPARTGCRVLAPGDREWQEADARLTRGAPLAPEAAREFEVLAARYGLEAPRPLDG